MGLLLNQHKFEFSLALNALLQFVLRAMHELKTFVYFFNLGKLLLQLFFLDLRSSVLSC